MSWASIGIMAVCAALGFGIVWSLGDKKPPRKD